MYKSVLTDCLPQSARTKFFNGRIRQLLLIERFRLISGRLNILMFNFGSHSISFLRWRKLLMELSSSSAASSESMAWLTFWVINIKSTTIISWQKFFKNSQTIFKLFQNTNNKIIIENTLLCFFQHSSFVFSFFVLISCWLTFWSWSTEELHITPVKD